MSQFKKWFVSLSVAFALFALCMAFGSVAFAGAPTIQVKLGTEMAVAENPVSLSWSYTDDSGNPISYNVPVTVTLGTWSGTASGASIKTGLVVTQTGSMKVRILRSSDSAVLVDSAISFVPGPIAKVEVSESDGSGFSAGEPVVMWIGTSDRFGNRVENAAGKTVWYRLDLPGKSVVASVPFTGSLWHDFATRVISTTKTGMAYASVCVDGICGKFEHAIVAAEVVSLTVSSPTTVTTGSKFEVVATGTDQFGNASGEAVQYAWKSADSSGNLTSVRKQIAVNAGSVTGTMSITAQVGKVSAKVSIAVVEKMVVATSGSAGEWKALDSTQMPEVKPGAKIVVRSGMTWWELSEAAYGNGANWQKIASANPGGLTVGSTITIPVL